MSRLGVFGLGLVLVASGSLLLATSGAGAHERRTVGRFNFVVGFLNEPALVDEPNSVDLRISNAADGTPVTGAEQTLKVELSQGTHKLTLDLAPRFNTPGAYNAYFMPTKTGVYVFRFTGAIEGTAINETFTSSPTTFSLVAEPKAFPERPQADTMAASAGNDGGDEADTALFVGLAGVVIGTAALALSSYSLRKRP